MTNTDWKALGVLTVFSTVVLFFVSQDSYLYDLHTRVDSAWFFMCGKAWMNGLIPYVDFSDSKGPLLWLIYGLGYLIQHTNYLGVFWISCIWYGLTYFYSYKTANLFLNDSRKALSCAILLTLAFFNPWFHNETRAEDFCLLFMNISLYRVCLIMYGQRVSQKAILTTFAILGFCFGALFLIKYSIAAMQASFIVCALVFLLKEKMNWWKPFFWGVSGFCAVLLPFLCCFLIEGNLTAFIQEYFFRTMQTVNNSGANWSPDNLLLANVDTDNPLLTYLLEWGDLLYTPVIAVVFITLIFDALLFARKHISYRWVPLFASLWIFAFTIPHHTGYYFNICSFLFVFLIIGLFDIFNSGIARRALLITTVTAFIIIPAYVLTYSFRVLIFNANANQEDFYKVSYVMSQIEKPRLINAYEYEQGFGILSESLPAGKYWVRQNGMPPEMMQEHEVLILSGTADFIIIDENSFSISSRIQEQELLDLGYTEYLRFGEFDRYILFSKKPNLDIKENVTPSHIDLFLKRDCFKGRTN